MNDDRTPMQNALPEGDKIPVRFPKMPNRRARGFLVLVIAFSFAVAVCGILLLWQGKSGGPLSFAEWFRGEKTLPDETPPSADPPAEEVPDTAQKIETKDEATDETPEVPHGSVGIVTRDLSGKPGEVHNLSVYTPDLSKTDVPPVATADKKGPHVLILCTHGSECYATGNYVSPPVGDAIYSEDPAGGVLAIGEALAESLKCAGVESIFCATRHDTPTLRSSYARAAESIAFFLERYPSITYVIDLHRDGLLAEDGSLIRAAVEDSGGAPVAQMLMVVGSNGDGSPDYAWEENLALARYLEGKLNETCKNLCRPTSLRNSPYNQNLAPRSLLIEVGAAGNTKEEALSSIEIFARVLAQYLKQ